MADDDSEGVREICEKNKVKCEIQPATDPIGLNNSSVNIEETCIECDSTNNTRCRMEPELFKGKICDRIKNSGRRGCYLSIVSMINFSSFFHNVCFSINSLLFFLISID